MIAGSGRLYNLVVRAKHVAMTTSGAERVVAFVLFAVFKSLAERMDGEPVTEPEGKELYQRLHSPIAEAIDWLAGDAPSNDAVNVASAVVDAHFPPQTRH